MILTAHHLPSPDMSRTINLRTTCLPIFLRTSIPLPRCGIKRLSQENKELCFMNCVVFGIKNKRRNADTMGSMASDTQRAVLPDFQKFLRERKLAHERHHTSDGGGGGIRTLGGVAPTTIFETVPFNHSGTPPREIIKKIITML